MSASLLAVSVAEDLTARVHRLRTAHEALAESVDGVEQERAAFDACQISLSGDSPVQQRFGRAERDLQDEQSGTSSAARCRGPDRDFDPALAYR